MNGLRTQLLVVVLLPGLWLAQGAAARAAERVGQVEATVQPLGLLLRVAPLSLIGTYAYVNPVVAVILGAVVLAEPITPRTLLAGAIIIVAVAIIVTARGRIPRRAQPEPETA